MFFSPEFRICNSHDHHHTSYLVLSTDLLKKYFNVDKNFVRVHIIISTAVNAQWHVRSLKNTWSIRARRLLQAGGRHYYNCCYIFRQYKRHKLCHYGPMPSVDNCSSSCYIITVGSRIIINNITTKRKIYRAKSLKIIQ